MKCHNFKDINEWTHDFDPVRYLSKQSNRFDCGIYTAIAMEKLMLDPLATIDQQESENPRYRRELCLRMLNFADSL